MKPIFIVFVLVVPPKYVKKLLKVFLDFLKDYFNENCPEIPVF